MLELVARVPYQAWENVAYVAVDPHRSSDRLRPQGVRHGCTARFEQDNEQWHLLILEELTAGQTRPWIRTRIVPQLLAFFCYQPSWVLVAVRPAWSYWLSADFEDHAEHEYAVLVQENPAWEAQRYEGQFTKDFGAFDSWRTRHRLDWRIRHRLEGLNMTQIPKAGARGLARCDVEAAGCRCGSAPALPQPSQSGRRMGVCSGN